MFIPRNLGARALGALALGLYFVLSPIQATVITTQSKPGGEPIAFYSDRDGDTEIYVMSADGSRVKALTQNAVEDRDPAWAPGGSRLAFISRRDADVEIYVVNADGTGLRRLTNRKGSDHTIRWSPDGRRIAFVSDVGGDHDIWVMAVDGSSPPVNVTDHEMQDFNPAWSAAGDEILFNSNREFPTSQDDMGDLYVVNLASGRTRRLQAERRTINGTWSPLGWIAFTAVPNRLREIFIVKPDGTGLRNLSRPVKATSDVNPVWSPDGSRLAFQGDRATTGNLEVTVMQADGSQVVRLSPPGQPTMGPPSWSADGRSVVYSVFEDANWEIYVSDVNGPTRRLTSNKAMDLGAVWAKAASERQ